VNGLVPDSTAQYRFDLKDGSVVYGIIEEAEVMGLTIRTMQLGVLTIQRGSIQMVHRLQDEPFSGSPRWFAALDHTNYLVLPSARPMDKGKVVYRNKYFGIQQVEAGVTKNLSVAGGLELFSLFQKPIVVPTFFAQVKAAFRVADDVHLGFGGSLFNSARRATSWNEEQTDRRNRGAAYGLITYGSRDSHLTIGAGAAADQDRQVLFPFVSVAAVIRVSQLIALTTENWLTLEEEMPYWSYGVRFMGQELSVDLALINNREFSERSVFGFPYVGFAVGF